MKKILPFLSLFLFAGICYLLINIPGGKETRKEDDSEKLTKAPAEEWFERQRAFPFDEIPMEERIKSIEYVNNQMPKYDFDGGNGWTLLGPANVEGRITTIAIHPADPNIVYTGTANGGIWKSTNFCQSWVSVFDNQATSSIGALAIDPSNPNILYCGTGESNSLRSYYPGLGMYKSTNAGANWFRIGLDSSHSIGNVVINPSNTQEVYAAVTGMLRRKNPDRGVYKSTNGGANWNKVLYVADSVGAIDVAIDPVSPNKLYAAMWERMRREDYVKYGGPMTALYVTTNSGANWSAVTGGFPSNEPTLGRISIDISRSNPQVIYALTAFTNGNSRGLYKSTNGGSNWALINSGAAGSSNYAWFNRTCRVNPSNPNDVYCGGLEMERSTNGGTSFNFINTSHVDQHITAFAPSNPNFVAVGNDGGIDYSTDGGASWNASASLPITQFYAGDLNPANPADIMGGAQDNGTNRSTGSVTWNEIYGGDGFYCLYDYSNAQYMYASSQNGGLGRSTNGGSSFFSGTSGLDLTYSNWMTPYVIDKNNPAKLYAGTYKIHRSTNRMQSWTPISPDLANAHVQNLGTITTIDAAKSDSNVIYCGTDDANVWVTTNGGANWTKINNGLPRRWVTRVAVHPNNAALCYVTLSGYKVDSTGSHIYRTTNYGNTWTSISTNLPDAPINDVIVYPIEPALFIATDAGVMMTSNAGTNWGVLGGASLPSSVPVHDLTFHLGTHKLIAWTHGRGAFAITVPPFAGVHNIGTEIPAGFKLHQNYPNPFNPETKIRFDITQFVGNGRDRSAVNLKIYDITGKEIAVLVNEELKAGTYEANWHAGAKASGVYFYTLTAGNFKETKRMVLVR
jgi:photosystem II stability/assembly factor-like uncharacterized protein